MNKTILVLMLATGLVVSGCGTWDRMERRERGAAIGAGTGAVAGSAVGGTTGTIVGGLGGGGAGYVIGREMEDDA